MPLPAIPRILHQTWKTETVPEPWERFYQSFGVHNAEFARRLWSDAEARRLVATEAPDLLATYDAYPYPILRADLFRYLVLLRYGGVYADLDVHFIAPVAPILPDRGVVLASESLEHARHHGVRTLVSNAFMASEPGHPFWLAVLEELRVRGPECLTHRDVLALTGPLMLQRVLDRFRDANGSDGIDVLPTVVVNPLTNTEAAPTRKAGHVDERLAARLRKEGTVALHVWSNSWVDTLAGLLENPSPKQVPGFTFFRGLDSTGFDVKNLGRRIPDVAEECLAMPEVVAFNTDGFAKHRLRPRWGWYRMRNWGPGEGLYVKSSEVRWWWLLPIPSSRR